ncbi:LamG-like jellyroll fold domain-containing protein [Paenibacillus sp. GCM10023252]|uniref:LamG-like jellyroll fold domain-containing protein n=1 Tax=Paenibacillus sp. GCM10023252 TaxID=3252649 RepID=UPI003616E2D3
MNNGKTVFLLKSDAQGAYDGSVQGISIVQSVGTKLLERETGFQLERGFIELENNKELQQLQAFTIEAAVQPSSVGTDRQNIVEGQTPSLALFIEKDGRVVGSVHTAAGWVGIDSGSTLVKANQLVHIRWVREGSGQSTLELDGQAVSTKIVAGPIVNTGNLGLKIGAWIDGKRFPFQGRISQLQIQSGAVNSQSILKKQQDEIRIAQSVKVATGIQNVKVNLIPDASRARLQPIKDIMNAAGVDKLSDLDTLKIVNKTVITPGKIIVAPRRSASPGINWGLIAKELATSVNAGVKREKLAQYLVNRNSTVTLKKFQTVTASTTATPRRPEIGVNRPVSRPQINLSSISSSAPLRREVRPNVASLFTSPSAGVRGGISLNDGGIFGKLEANIPRHWPGTAGEGVHLYTLKSIPIHSAVLIANTLDLTNTELVIEPNVTTFYIIAEKVICGDNAKITWRRPGGTTPARPDNPDLNGRGWSGVHTKPDSRDGLNGEDGRGGEPGIDGSKGATAPNLELWVRDMSAVPNIDLNGEEGRKGGRGQRGGRGGDGANGHTGERIWFFGWHCSADPGDGGEGGDGGDGGRGGRGGNGGTSGNITIGVLDGTLESTVTSRAFKLKNQGGTRGRGGDGGAGGFGGNGGRSGVGETCKDARDGRAGAQGQPGRQGNDGAYEGIDGSIQFYEFSEDAWEALLTRPWLSEITPAQGAPGDKITLRGSQFTSSDRVVFGGAVLVPAANADESLSISIPADSDGGDKTVYVRRDDGTESNRLTVRVKPQLDAFTAAIVPGASVVLTGKAFLPGASVLINGAANPAAVENRNRLSFSVPGTGGGGSSGGFANLQVRNPDGLVSNMRTVSTASVLEIPFKFGTHDLPFENFSDGIPSWGTYQDTFGAAEIWHELLDPVFGHPVLTSAYYFFYEHFLKGEDNGGLATGFCTSMASLVADNLWQGRNDTHTLTKAALHKQFTAIHGKLLSRETLIHFHDQGREGVLRVEKTYREIEATFLRGVDRNNAPLLFFIPSGAVWDSGYVDKLGSSHCVMPYRFVYPPGHPGPQLTPDGTSTITDLNGVEMFVWDCNNPSSADCKLRFTRVGGVIQYEFFSNSATPTFRSQDGITLGMMTNGQYLLADHDLPFSGHLGLTRFVIDFLLSPADLQITDEEGRSTGRFGSQIKSEIPGSLPCYLMKGAYLLPENEALTRKIVGTGSGTYTYNSILPNGLSIVIEGVSTAAGQQDVLTTNADYTQLRFTPGADKNVTMTLARQVDDEVRAIAIAGIGGGPAADVDITISPELSLVRVGNRSGAKSIEVKAFTVDKLTNQPLNKGISGVNLATKHDLLVAVPDWKQLDVNVQTISFE